MMWGAGAETLFNVKIYTLMMDEDSFGSDRALTSNQQQTTTERRMFNIVVKFYTNTINSVRLMVMRCRIKISFGHKMIKWRTALFFLDRIIIKSLFMELIFQYM